MSYLENKLNSRFIELEDEVQTSAWPSGQRGQGETIKAQKTVKVIKAQTRAPVDFVKLGFRADDQANGSRSSTCDFASEGTKGSMMSRTVAGSRISHSLTNVIPD